MAGSRYATASRRKILEYLKNRNDHTVTAADVDEYLKKHDSEVNITTIYRYLDKLAKDGTVIKYVAEKGCQAAYQYVEPGRGCEQHLHLKCVKCGKIIHLECHFMEEISHHIEESQFDQTVVFQFTSSDRNSQQSSPLPLHSLQTPYKIEFLHCRVNP